jgi:hypothetical protein
MHAQMRLTSRSGLTVVALTVVLGVAAAAQEPFGGGGPGGPGGRRDPGRQGGPMSQMAPVTAVDLPLPLITKALKLTNDQKTQVQAIQKTFRDAMRLCMAPPEQDAAPPGEVDMKAMMDKVAAARSAANRNVEALLTADQKSQLTTLLKDTNDYRAVGFPANVGDALKLTTEQRTQIASLAAKVRSATKNALAKTQASRESRDTLRNAIRQAHNSALALLTAEQRATLAKLRTKDSRDQDRGGSGVSPGSDGGYDGAPGGPPDDGAGGPDGGGPGEDGLAQ